MSFPVAMKTDILFKFFTKLIWLVFIFFEPHRSHEIFFRRDFTEILFIYPIISKSFCGSRDSLSCRSHMQFLPFSGYCLTTMCMSGLLLYSDLAVDLDLSTRLGLIR